MMQDYLWIAVGGALGSLGRFWLAAFITRHFGSDFPLGTLVVNVTGSFAIGFISAASGPAGLGFGSPGFRLFLMTGLCGGYTTFSAFSLQTFTLLRGGQLFYAALNAVLSFALCLGGVWLGYVAALRLISHRPN